MDINYELCIIYGTMIVGVGVVAYNWKKMKKVGNDLGISNLLLHINQNYGLKKDMKSLMYGRNFIKNEVLPECKDGESNMEMANDLLSRLEKDIGFKKI